MTTPTPGRINVELDGASIRISIERDGTSYGTHLCPDEAYSVARYLEWIVEAGETPEPNNPCPIDVGVWYEHTDTGRYAHVVIVDPDTDEDSGAAIMLDASHASFLSNSLYRHAVQAAYNFVEEDDNE
jgi:hypothetical protein